MTTKSRTRESIHNSIAAFVLFWVNLILQFYSRKIFLDYLGTEILGLNTTAVNMLQFLNLAELGVWSAIASSLYKPINENNIREIKQIIAFNGYIYRYIAWFIVGASVILMCFFPVIFSKMKLPLWYAYASFIVLLFASLLSYFVNYKQFLLTADQQNYKVVYTYKLSMTLKVLAQIFALSLLPNPYIWWLILEFLFTIIGSVSLNWIIKRTYPFLSGKTDSYKALKAKYGHIITKIKQVFVQKIAGFVLFQTSPLILYALANLTLVALYGNYMLIIQGLISLMAAVFNGMAASIGNLVVSSDISHVYDVFYQLNALRMYMIAVLSYGAWVFTETFIRLWIGQEYLLPASTLAILILTFYFYTNRYLIYDFLTAYGYFGDIWASVIEVVLNIGLSVGLGILWGLNGVLSGVLISTILISCLWKPFYLFRIKLHFGLRRYMRTYTLIFIVSFGLMILINHISEHMLYAVNDIIASAINIIIYTVSLFAVLFIFHKPFAKVIHRFI